MIDKFDMFNSKLDLPVSEEMLGAYLEDNLTDAESLFVRSQIDSDLYLTNLEFAVRSYGDDMLYVDNEVYVSDGLDLIELPNINNDILPEDVAYIHSDVVQSDLIEETDYSSYQLPEIDSFHGPIDDQETSEFDDNL